MKTTKESRWTGSALLVWVAAGSLAHAFYNPTSGRWLSRDPIEENGGVNVHAFVLNAPIQHFDMLGKFPTTSFCIVLSKCGDKSYDPRHYCCCRSNVVSKAPADTGVVKHIWRANPDGSGKLHVWVTWDGGSADSNSDSIVMEPGSGIAQSPAGATPSPSTDEPIKLSPCDCDFKKLNACLTRKASEMNGTQQGDCRAFAGKLIGECEEESRGCTATP